MNEGDIPANQFALLVDSLRATLDDIGTLASGVRAQKEGSQLARVRIEYQRRRRREAIFPTSIFGEPAWDLLLDLFIAHKLGKRISVSSACIASSVPNSTALRWINYLVELGLTEKYASESDKRVVYVRLSEQAIQGMDQYLAN